MDIGLIGAGLMGRGMALRLLAAGHTLRVVSHRQRTVIDELVAQGAIECGSVAQIAAASDIVITCLPSADIVEDVLFGDAGIVASARPGLLVVESSTSLPDRTRAFAARLAAHGIALVDAPITGGPAEAVEGTLTALVGGDPVDVARARDVLDAYCATVFVFGATGAGHAAKLINNGMGFGILGVVAEALATAMAERLDIPSLLQMIALSGAHNRVLQGLGPWLTTGDESFPRVTVATASKDLRYYAELAEAAGTTGPVLSAVRAQFAHVVEAGAGERMLPAYPASIARGFGIEPGPVAAHAHSGPAQTGEQR